MEINKLCPFRFETNELAHAFYPKAGELSGELHFNSAVKWTRDSSASGFDLPSVALHEIGHSLGLEHSPDSSSVMYAYFPLGSLKRDLTPDDIAGIQAIYGKVWCSDYAA
jgi:predicted Zn-dependent protease